MSPYSRRQVIGLAALAGGTVSGGAAYGLWQAFGGEAPPLRSPEADLTRWRRLDAGRPILVAVPQASRTPFNSCIGEVLLAEGVNAFTQTTLDEAIGYGLERCAVVVLGAGQLTGPQVEAVARYVSQGGRLVTMQPCAALASSLGLTPLGVDVADGDILLAPEHEWTSGLTARAIRVHALARPCRAGGDEVLATLTARDGGPTHPAVLLSRTGRGVVVQWSFDVAEAVVLARQGNPVLAGSSNVHRAADLFAGWLDPVTLDLPHADEHARFLVRVLTRLLDDVCPLPRLWYFPDNAPAMLVATGDAHQSPASAIDDVLARVEAHDGTMSIYFTPPLSDAARRVYRHARNWLRDVPAAGPLANGQEVVPSPAEVARWRARGHEFGLHVFVEGGWEQGWDAAWRSFTGLRYGPVSPTTRTHRVLWNGWATSAVLQAERGIRMNCDYYHFGDLLRDDTGVWRYGYLTGSGLPARFADDRGRVLDIFQQCTHLVDEHLMQTPWSDSGPRLEPDTAAAVSREVLTLAAHPASPGAVCAQFHVDPFAMGEEWRARFGAWLDATLSAAGRLGIPIVSAERWLASLDVRFGTTLDDLQWDGEYGRLSLHASVPDGSGAPPTLLVPTRFGGKDLAGVRMAGGDAVTTWVDADLGRFARVALRPGRQVLEAHYR